MYPLRIKGLRNYLLILRKDWPKAFKFWIFDYMSNQNIVLGKPYMSRSLESTQSKIKID